jgi:uncharacterized membrane protein
MIELTPRTLAKTVTWRITTTILTFLVSYAVTGGFGSAGKIAGVLFVVNSLWYFVHERVWNKIMWKKT